MSSRCRATCLPWALPATTLSSMRHYTTSSCPACVITSCPGEEVKERTGVTCQASWQCLIGRHVFTPPPLWQIYQALLQITWFLKTTTTKLFYSVFLDNCENQLAQIGVAFHEKQKQTNSFSFSLCVERLLYFLILYMKNMTMWEYKL